MKDDPTSQAELSRRALQDRDAFWREQAKAIEWQTPFATACDFSRPPFVKWFPGGTTNLCHNAVDRHLTKRAEQTAIRFLSSETGEEKTLTYRELHREVNRMASVLLSLGLIKGDRIVLYLPMIPEAAIAMLACVRLGLIHSTVFAGFAAESLARRITDAEARLVITCDAGLRNKKIVPLKKTTDAALNLAKGDTRVLFINRELDPTAAYDPQRDIDYFQIAAQHVDAEIPCAWLESTETSYILYTSGTTARPKGVQRDTGGYAVALAASMKHIFGGQPGETFFCTADVGWVVGHSYTVYGALIHGMTTVIYEGLPVCPDAGIWWKIAQETKATVMFSSPTAMRVLKKHDPAIVASHDLSHLRTIFLAGEPLDEPTWEWIHHALPHVQIVDNYWQTESGWPILASLPGAGILRTKPGSPGFPVYGYDAFIADEQTGEPMPRGERGVLAIRLPLPPGCLTTIWKNDALFADQYCSQFSGKLLYSTFDYATQDEDGFFFVLGRMDDVINVAGHRIGTREIEEAICSHPAVAEAAAVGAADELKWQVVKCFVVLKYPEHYATGGARSAVIAEIEKSVITELGALARPAFIGLVRQLPKTRSGKVMRRAILAIAESRDPGDLSTLDDPQALDQIRESHALAATK
ncbi:propionate--CoA ligase [soil metagenome]